MFRHNRWSFQKLLTAGFVIIVAFFLSVAFLTYRSIQDYLASVSWVAHTYEVGETLDHALGLMQESVTQQRGYVVTGNEQYLRQYRQTVSELDTSMRDVYHLTRSNPTQSQHFTQLRALKDSRMRLNEYNIEARKAHGEEAVLVINRRGGDLESLRITEGYRQLISVMKDEETRLLKLRTEQAQGTAQNSLALLASLFFLVLLFLGAFYLLLTKENRQRLKAENRLSEMNEHLEQLVEERTRSIYAEQKRTKAILESSLDAIITIDEQGAVLEWNPGAERTFGYQRDEVVGKPLPDLIIPERLQQRHREGFQHFLRSGEGPILNKLVELPALRSNGSEFPVELSITHMEIEGHSYFTSMVRDITQRKRAEQELLESEARFRTLADSAPVMIWQSGPDSLYTYFNQGWLDFTGQTLARELGDGWLERVHPEDSRFCRETYTQAFNAREPFYMEYRLKRQDGEYRWIGDTGTPRFSPDYEFLGFIGTCLDVTERREMTEELERRVQERTEQLEAVNKELESFSYSVSHDLRAPLRGIDGFSLALLEDYNDRLDDEGKEYLGLIRKETQRMAQLIDDLLELSRLTRGQLSPQQVDLSEIARELGNAMKRQEPNRDVDFKVQDNVTVYGDSRLLQAALQNLLSNAWKFTSHHPSAHIEFGMQKQNGSPVYYVKDDGAGFDMNYKGKLFGAFQRLHQASEFPGTGIGLATVQRIIHRHNGEIWAEGAVEKGATMYFTLGTGAEAETGRTS